MSTEEPGTRTVVEAMTPEGRACNLIVCRHGIGRDARVWVSFHGVAQTTAVLRPSQVYDLHAALRKAAA